MSGLTHGFVLFKYDRFKECFEQLKIFAKPKFEPVFQYKGEVTIIIDSKHHVLLKGKDEVYRVINFEDPNKTPFLQHEVKIQGSENAYITLFHYPYLLLMTFGMKITLVNLITANHVLEEQNVTIEKHFTFKVMNEKYLILKRSTNLLVYFLNNLKSEPITIPVPKGKKLITLLQDYLFVCIRHDRRTTITRYDLNSKNFTSVQLKKKVDYIDNYIVFTKGKSRAVYLWNSDYTKLNQISFQRKLYFARAFPFHPSLPFLILQIDYLHKQRLYVYSKKDGHRILKLKLGKFSEITSDETKFYISDTPNQIQVTIIDFVN